MLYSAYEKDRNGILDSSKRLGILTGEESRDMLETHVQAVTLIGEPFRTEGLFDFGNQTLTKRIYERMPEIIEKRLKPPSQEVFALHRLLGGAFFMCMRLKAKVRVQDIFLGIHEKTLKDFKGA